MAYTVHYRNEAPVPPTIHGPTFQRAVQEGFDCGFRAAYWHIAVACNLLTEMLCYDKDIGDPTYTTLYTTYLIRSKVALWVLADLGDEDAFDMTNNIRVYLLWKEICARVGTPTHITKDPLVEEIERYARFDRMSDANLLALCEKSCTDTSHYLHSYVIDTVRSYMTTVKSV